ncbi:MAG: isochorismatase family protein [Candidatus Hydrogenedentales bacterium]
MLEKDRSVLVIVDIQEVLMPKSAKVVSNYLFQCVKLAGAAKLLDIPILITEQNPERLGTTTEKILEVVGDVPRIPKLEFSCLANESFAAALEAYGRKQLVILGMETHVCIMQTALTAAALGYESFIARDAVVSTRKKDHDAALWRMAQGGVNIGSTEMIIFEWLRVAGTEEFKKLLPLIKS